MRFFVASAVVSILASTASAQSGGSVLAQNLPVTPVVDPASGRLVQDVPSQHPDARTHMVDWVEFAEAGPGEHWHRMDVEPSSRLAGWVGDGEPLVNSFHHQAVAETGERLRPVAVAEDGVIEATESAPDAPFAVGLQWHNEFMWRRDPRWLGPFRDLVTAARERATGFAGTHAGLQSVAPTLVAYASTEAHSSIEKDVRIAGLGARNLRLAPSPGRRPAGGGDPF